MSITFSNARNFRRRSLGDVAEHIRAAHSALVVSPTFIPAANGPGLSGWNGAQLIKDIQMDPVLGKIYRTDATTAASHHCGPCKAEMP